MNKLFFTGRVAAAPEFKRHGATAVTKFRLIRNEYAGKDDKNEAMERQVAVPFTAFGKIAEAISEHVLKGDQLVIEARLENNKFTDGQGVERYDYNFIVAEFEFGAPGEEKRKQLAERAGR